MMKRFFIVGPGGREGYGRHDGQHIRTQKHINTHTPYTLVNEKKQNKTTGYGNKTRLWQHGEGNTLLEITGADRKHFALCVCVHADGPERLREYRPARTTDWK